MGCYFRLRPPNETLQGALLSSLFPGGWWVWGVCECVVVFGSGSRRETGADWDGSAEGGCGGVSSGWGGGVMGGELGGGGGGLRWEGGAGGLVGDGGTCWGMVEHAGGWLDMLGDVGTCWGLVRQVDAWWFQWGLGSGVINHGAKERTSCVRHVWHPCRAPSSPFPSTCTICSLHHNR